MPLLAQFNENAKLSMLRNATWTLSNFCRGKPQPSFDQVNVTLPICLGVLVSVYWLSFFVADSALHIGLVRRGLHFQLLHSLFIQMTKKSLQMLVGHCHTSLMVPMTRSRLSLRLVSVLDLWSFYCEYLTTILVINCTFMCLIKLFLHVVIFPHLSSFPHCAQLETLSLVMTFRLRWVWLLY